MLSFIVPAYNEEHELPLTLAAIRSAAQLAGHPHEIIVVDDDSNDATAEVAERGGARVVQIQRRQIAAARNAGGRAARGEILFFIDADTRISSRHVSDALRALADGFAGGGARVTTDGAIPRWGQFFIYAFCTVYFALNLGAGAFLFTTHENFEKAGGFDEDLFAGEEVYFSQALKKLGRFKILREPVVTSGRKLRMHSARHILSQSFAIVIGGKRAVQSREKLDIWYDGKRETQVSERARSALD